MGWGRYLLMLGVVIVGLIVVEEVAPKAALPLVLVILLGVAFARPNFWPEFLGTIGAQQQPPSRQRG